jgi:hypothetical protein
LEAENLEGENGEDGERKADEHRAIEPCIRPAR